MKEDMQQMSKDMKRVKVVKRPGKKENLKQVDEQKTNLYSTTIKLTLIHKKYC